MDYTFFVCATKDFPQSLWSVLFDQRLANLLLQLLARLEGGNTPGSDLERLSGFGVACGAGFPLADEEGAEADQGDGLLLFERFGDIVEDRGDRAGGGALAQAAVLGDFLNQLGLVHERDHLLCGGASDLVGLSACLEALNTYYSIGGGGRS